MLSGAHFPVSPHAQRGRAERESRESGRGVLQLVTHKKPITVDSAGADGSAEGRWCFFYNIFCVRVHRYHVVCAMNH